GMDRKRYLPGVVVWNFCEDDGFVSQIRALGVPLYSFASTDSRIAKLRVFRHMVMQIKPELVHSCNFYLNFVAWWATLGTKSLPMGAVRSDFTYDRKESGPLLGRLSARWPRSQIVNNFAAVRNTQSARSLFVPGKLFVVRNGLDLQRFRMVP